MTATLKTTIIQEPSSATAASVADGAWRHAVGTGLNTSNLFFTVASGITANSLSAIGYIYLTSSNQVVISAEL
jgi:hypothetical protein